jgi:hypothetical protein
MHCSRSFHTAERTIEGIEAAHMMRKGQVKRLDGRDAAGQATFVRSMFGVAAWRWDAERPPLLQSIFATEPRGTLMGRRVHAVVRHRSVIVVEGDSI